MSCPGICTPILGIRKSGPLYPGIRTLIRIRDLGIRTFLLGHPGIRTPVFGNPDPYPDSGSGNPDLSTRASGDPDPSTRASGNPDPSTRASGNLDPSIRESGDPDPSIWESRPFYSGIRESGPPILDRLLWPREWTISLLGSFYGFIMVVKSYLTYTKLIISDTKNYKSKNCHFFICYHKRNRILIPFFSKTHSLVTTFQILRKYTFVLF